MHSKTLKLSAGVLLATLSWSAISFFVAPQAEAYVYCKQSNGTIRYDALKMSCSSGETDVTAQADPSQGGTLLQGMQATNRSGQAVDPARSGLDTVGTFLSDIIYWIGPGIATYIAYIGAYFFSIVIQLSLNSTAYALQFLSEGWGVVRDLANMAFIFILIYIALKVMLQAEETGTIKTLAIVIVVALLVNFSFFFTRVVVDTGNILALQFYNAIPLVTNADGTPAVLASGGSTGQGVKDLSASLMGALQIQSLLNQKVFDQAKNSCGPAGNGFWCGLIVSTVIYLAMAVMLWMLFFAFLQVGIKFLLRIVGLWFLLIASPLAFVAKTIKQTEGYFDAWLKALIKFSFYPAIFLFMFWIVTKFSSALLTVPGQSGSIFNGILNSATNSGTNGAFLSVASSVANVGIRMGFIIALMYVALHVSEWIVKEGSGIAGAVTGRVSSFARGTARGALRYGPGWAGGALYRGTVAAGANKLSKAIASTPRLNQGLLGALAYRTNKHILKPAAETSLGTFASSFKEREEFKKKRAADWGNNLRDKENSEAVAKAGEKIESNIKAGRIFSAGMSDAEQKAVQKLNKRELEALSTDHILKVSALLTEDQIKRVQEMEKLTDKQKEEAKTTWDKHSTYSAFQRSDKTLDDIAKLTAAPSVVNAAKPGTVVTKALNDVIKSETADELDDAQAEHKAKEIALQAEINSPTSTAASRMAAKNAYGVAITMLRNAKSAADKAGELEKEREKIPANIAGTPNAKEFVKK
jgi:hypothetical protein